MAAPMNPPTSARAIRAKLGRVPFPVTIAPGVTIIVRTIDILTAYVNDMLPMPLLEAANDMNAWRNDLAKRRDAGEVFSGDPLQEVDAARRLAWLDALRRVAMLAAVSPELVAREQDIQDPDRQMPVTDLDFTSLVAIYDAAPPPEAVLTEVQAQTFPERTTRAPRETAAAVGPVADVPAAPVPLARADADGGYFLNG